jgi:hypothetical protein
MKGNGDGEFMAKTKFSEVMWSILGFVLIAGASIAVIMVIMR